MEKSAGFREARGGTVLLPRYPEFFNDVFGPVMQPGSSSHFAGPCRIGLLAASLFGEDPVRAEFALDPAGSYAGAFGIMNEDLGMLGGVLGLGPEDPRLFDAKKIAAARGLSWEFRLEAIPESRHPNAVKIRLRGGSGREVEMIGDSTGGGMVEVRSIQGFPVSFAGDTTVILDFNVGDAGYRPGSEVLESGLIERNGARLSWHKVTGRPGVIPPDALVMDPVLPVPTVPGRGPQLFDSMTSWRKLADDEGVGLAEIALRYEEAASAWPRDRVISAMENIRGILSRQVSAAYGESPSFSESPFQRRDDLLWPAYESRGPVLSGPITAKALKRALGVNAKPQGVPIVPGPMGTGGGYLYSALSAVREARGFSPADELRGLFIAAGVGAIAYTRSNPTGEVMGCAGESGVCSAMTSAAIVEMAGGSPRQVENAASFALQAMIGLPCDPMPGGFGQPCLSRVLSAVGNAILFADLALAGSDAVLPFHDALEAADKVGRALPPELRCTSLGGCCDTATGKRLHEKFRRWRKSMAAPVLR